jgi:hypothetical protein
VIRSTFVGTTRVGSNQACWRFRGLRILISHDRGMYRMKQAYQIIFIIYNFFPTTILHVESKFRSCKKCTRVHSSTKFSIHSFMLHSAAWRRATLLRVGRRDMATGYPLYLGTGSSTKMLTGFYSYSSSTRSNLRNGAVFSRRQGGPHSV